MFSSLFSRISISLIGSVSVAAISFLTSIFLARILGASEFGLYQYILSIGQSIILIAGLNAGNAYFTFISKHTYQLLYHLVYTFIQTLLACIAIFVAIFFMGDYLFEDMELKFIVICLFGSFGFFLLRQQAIYILESLRRNAFLQFILVSTSILNLLILVTFSITGTLAISDIFLVMAILYLTVWALTLFLFSSYDSKGHKELIFRQQINSYVSYVKPLILSLVIVQMGVIFDRWMLQVYGGSTEQAFFGIALRIATIATIVSASTSNIFWKEISALLNENKKGEAKNLLLHWHDRVITIVFFGCLFIFVNAEHLITLSYGQNYLQSTNALKIISFYPLLQTSVHLLSAFLYSQESTFEVAKASIVTSILGGLIIWLLFVNDFGFSGSVILSFKFMIVSFLLIVMLGKNLDILKKLLPIKKYLIILPGITLLTSFFHNWITNYELQIILHLIISGAFMGSIYLTMFMKKSYA